MIGELHPLAFGPVGPAVAALFAAPSFLLAIVLTARARRSTGLRRLRLVAYSTTVLAGPGIWLPALVGVLGVRVENSVVRLTALPLLLGLAVAVGVCAAAVVVLSYVRPGAMRAAGAALLLMGAVGGCGYLTLEAIATGGDVVYAGPAVIGAPGTVAIIAVGLAGALTLTRSMRWAMIAAGVLAVAMSGLTVVAGMTLAVRPRADGVVPADEVVGLAPLEVGVAAVVCGGVLTALLWYFSLGTSTRRELSMAFGSPVDADQIEPWMIEQVQARVALSTTAFAPVTPAARVAAAWAGTTVAVRSIPVLGPSVASAFARRQVPALRYAPRPMHPPITAELVTPDRVALDTPVSPAGVPVSPAAAPVAPAAAPTSPAAAPTSPAAAPTSPAAGPRPAWNMATAWRPVPGWGDPNAIRSLLGGEDATSAAAGARPEAEPGRRQSSRWEQRDWDRDPEHNEPRSGLPRRATNSRHGRTSRDAHHLVATPGDRGQSTAS